MPGAGFDSVGAGGAQGVEVRQTCCVEAAVEVSGSAGWDCDAVGFEERVCGDEGVFIDPGEGLADDGELGPVTEGVRGELVGDRDQQGPYSLWRAGERDDAAGGFEIQVDPARAVVVDTRRDRRV